MSSRSQNGWPVLDQSETFKWVLPIQGAPRHLILRPGNAGFVLAHFALWYHERVQELNEGIWDEWGWAARAIRGSNTISNHASGTAIDLNATKHPLGAVGTLKFLLKRGTRQELAEVRINRVLRGIYENVIRGGLNYSGRKDEMHYEINVLPGLVRTVAARLRKTKRGKRLMKANPGYKP